MGLTKGKGHETFGASGTSPGMKQGTVEVVPSSCVYTDELMGKRKSVSKCSGKKDPTVPDTTPAVGILWSFLPGHCPKMNEFYLIRAASNTGFEKVALFLGVLTHHAIGS
jgi:hypothetical protein